MLPSSVCPALLDLPNLSCQIPLTQRQARFLATVALSGGYCTRRHYATFARIAYGATVRDFLERLVRRRWMGKFEYRRDRGFVYHLRATAVYRAIDMGPGQGCHSPTASFIARKLMVLDVVLAHPQASWFFTETAKVALFAGLGVPLEDLPHRTFRSPSNRLDPSPTRKLTRYFVDSGPIFVKDDGVGDRINFVVLALDATGAAVRRFLMDHSRLLPHLSVWTLLAVSPYGQSNLATSEAAFKRAVARARHSAEDDLTEPSELVRYFEVRLAFEKDRSTLSIADVDLLRAARLTFIGPEIERRYSTWCHSSAVSRSRASDRHLNAGPAKVSPRYPLTVGEFQSYELPHAYEQFGDFPGVC